jgi:indole-3-glycerol phosphate synthase
MLKEFIANKRKEIKERKKSVLLSSLEEQITQMTMPFDLAQALSGDRIRLIAEVKHASPSGGVLRANLDPVALAKTYVRSGAAAISVLTDEKYFHGSLEHLARIRKAVGLPLLRKDFIIDRYQVYESRAYGADALLLLVAVLSQGQLEELLSLSHSLGMKCLVEVHNEKEVERALRSVAKIIGINNRDLDTFTTDIDTTRRLCPLIPSDRIVVSESGIKSRNDVEKLKAWGVNAILVGEALVTSASILNKIRELVP